MKIELEMVILLVRSIIYYLGGGILVFLGSRIYRKAFQKFSFWFISRITYKSNYKVVIYGNVSNLSIIWHMKKHNYPRKNLMENLSYAK